MSGRPLVFATILLDALRLGACAGLLSACGAGTAATGPEASIRAYGRALSEGQAERTWVLLDEDARRGRTEAEHRALMTANAQELQAQGEAIRRAAGTDAVIARARVPLASGEVVVLILEEGRWHIEGGLLNATASGTPLDAIAAFRRALMRRDLPGIERVLSRQTRAEWEAEVRRIVEGISDTDDLAVEVEGNRAHVRTTGGGSIELVRESGEWRVIDVSGQ